MDLVGTHPAPVEAIPALWAVMSGADRTELSALVPDGVPQDSIALALNKSFYTFSYYLGAQPVALGGAYTFGSRSALWMIASTPILAHHKKSFLQASQQELAAIRFLTAKKEVWTIVDIRWRKSIKWLEWLGFSKQAVGQVVGRQAVHMVLS